MNLTVLFAAKGKIVGQTGLFNQLGEEKLNTEQL